MKILALAGLLLSGCVPYAGYSYNPNMYTYGTHYTPLTPAQSEAYFARQPIAPEPQPGAYNPGLPVGTQPVPSWIVRPTPTGPQPNEVMSYAQVHQWYAANAPGHDAPDTCPYPQGSNACRQWATDRSSYWNQKMHSLWQQADDSHVCNSINPAGCLSEERKRDIRAAQAQQSRDAAECATLNDGSCARVQGGVNAATSQYQRMNVNGCLRTFQGVQDDYYGTEHLPCEFVR